MDYVYVFLWKHNLVSNKNYNKKKILRYSKALAEFVTFSGIFLSFTFLVMKKDEASLFPFPYCLLLLPN